MDWLRRNWPDLLIGLALIAVIAGIVSTLLTGGSFFPSEGSTGGTTATQTGPSQSGSSATSGASSSTAANGPVVVPSDGASSTATEGPGSSAVTPPGAPDPAVVTTPATATQASTAEASASESTRPSTVTVAPLAPGDDVASSTSTSGGASGSSSAPSPARAAATPPATPTPATSSASRPASSSASARPTQPFRISVGAFSVRENAERQAGRFRADGYPVFLGEQGSLTLVLVGPYDGEAEALRVAREIAAANDDVEPVVYEFRPEGGRADATVVTSPGASSTSTRNDLPSSSATTSTPTSVPATASGSAATEETGVSFQVGAFSTGEAARALVSVLASLGFEATEVREGGLIKIVVGPFEGQAAVDARTVLEGAGIEFFVRP